MHKASNHLQSIQQAFGESQKKHLPKPLTQKCSLGAQEEEFSVPTVTVGGSLCSHSSSCRSRSFPSSPVSPASAGRGLRGARLGNAGRHRALTGLHSTPLLTAWSCSALIPPSHNHLGGKGPPDIYSGSARSRLSQQSRREGFEDLPSYRLSMQPVLVLSV